MKSRVSYVIAALGILAMIPAGRAVCDAAPRAAASACDRQCLIGFADRYLDALLKHDPSGLPLARAYKFTENGQRLKLGEGLWHQASDIQFRQYFTDPEAGEVVFNGALEESDLPTLLMLRLRIEARRISEIETIVMRFNDGLDRRLATLRADQAFMDSVLPKDQQSSKKTLAAIANDYLNGLQDHPPTPFPITADCKRTEDGITTSRAVADAASGRPAGCDLNSPIWDYMTSVHDRRFVIFDRERGQAYVIGLIDCPGTLKTYTINGKTSLRSPGARRPREVLMGAAYKIVGGKLAEEQAFHVTNLPFGSRSGW